MLTGQTISGMQVHHSITSDGRDQYWVALPGGGTVAAETPELVRRALTKEGHVMDKPKVAIKHAITPEQASHRSGYVESWITKHAGLGHFICQQSSGKGGHWKIDRESFDAFVRQHQAAGPNHHPHHKARARVPQAKQKATTRRDEKYSIAERKGLALLVNGQAIALFDSGQRPLFERIVKLLALAEGM